MSDDAAEGDWGGPDWAETGRQLEESGKLDASPDLMKMRRRLRVLIVGGGAIGPVYGYHIKEAGAHVSMFVKPKYAARAEDGYTLHPYGVAGKRSNRHFQPDEVVSELAELRENTYDQVWLCVSSPALRDGFLERLFQSCITASIWVSFQPGLKDWEFLTQTIPPKRLVMGMVNFIAYQAPLPGEDLWPEGVAHFIPPWSMSLFSGQDEEGLYASAVASSLQRGVGRLVGAVVPNAAARTRAVNALLVPSVIALESVQWSIDTMRANQSVVDLTRRAVTDLQVALERQTGEPTGKWRIVQKPWFWKVALFAAPFATAFPLEAYLRHHYTKLREQTDQMVDDLIALCIEQQVPPSSLQALRDEWRSRRGAIASLDPDEYDRQTGRRLSVATPMPAAAPSVDPAAASVDFRAAPHADVADSQSLLVGDVSSEFESEDTPPPTAPPQIPDDEVDDSSGEVNKPGAAAGDEQDEPLREREDTPMPAAILPVPGINDKPIPMSEVDEAGEPDVPPREREDTPMPAAILPVPGITDKPVQLDDVELVDGSSEE